MVRLLLLDHACSLTALAPALPQRVSFGFSFACNGELQVPRCFCVSDFLLRKTLTIMTLFRSVMSATFFVVISHHLLSFSIFGSFSSDLKEGVSSVESEASSRFDGSLKQLCAGEKDSVRY
jgi:hypothetical protein